MSNRVVRVGSLEEFVADVPDNDSPVVRLSLTERWDNGIGGLPRKTVELHLQGVNDLDEIVWLMESHTLDWIREGPATPREKSIYEQMPTMRDLVRAHLESLGYEVRSGSYGIPKDIQPVRGGFECVTWRKDGEDRFAVVPAGSRETVGCQGRGSHTPGRG